MGRKEPRSNTERQRQCFSRKFKPEVVRLLELEQKPGTQLSLDLKKNPGKIQGQV